MYILNKGYSWKRPHPVTTKGSFNRAMDVSSCYNACFARKLIILHTQQFLQKYKQ